MTSHRANLGLLTICTVLAAGMSVSGCATDAAQTNSASTQAMSSSLRRLNSDEISRLISGHSVAAADIVGAGVEMFHDDGRYEVRSRTMLSGQYEINNALLCTWLNGPRHHRCRQIFVDPAGDVFSVQVDGESVVSETPLKIKIM